ncbi:MAG: response regulator transcription factor [Bacteroidota bacterium]
MKILIAHQQPVCCRGIGDIILATRLIKNVIFIHGYDELSKKLKEENCECLIMDDNLPGKDILESVPWLLKIKPALKIILLLLNENAARVRKLFDLGVSGCLYKNAGEGEFAQAVKSIKDGKTYLSACYAEQLIKEKPKATDDEKTVKEKAKLSDREHEVYLLLRQKKTGKEIADALCISKDTFKTHRWHLRKKLKKARLLYLLDG